MKTFSKSFLFFTKASKSKLLLILFSLLLLAGCTLFDPNTTTCNVTLAPGESYTYDLGVDSYLETAMVIVEPLHADVSQTYWDTTDIGLHYLYIPDSSYTGPDYVKFELAYLEHAYNSSFKTEGYVEINFTIREP